MTVNITTTGKIDIPFETYVDGEKVIVDQPNTMYTFKGNVVNFVKDFTTSEAANHTHGIPAQGNNTPITIEPQYQAFYVWERIS